MLEVAAELARRGHSACIYSPRVGGELPIAANSAGVRVVDDLAAMDWQPDLIHAQHHLETLTALCHFVDTPAVMFCHGMVPWEEKPIRHPRIRRYVAVSEAIRQRIMAECEVDASRISLISNFVDLQRFVPRSAPLPRIPRKALLFSNYAVSGGYADVVAQVCAQHGLSLHVVGRGYGNATETPERTLLDYDIVFAHGRAALEALAIGAAVICCDKQGAAPMVTTTNLDWFRLNNFGFAAQTHSITAEYLSEQISAYDSEDAAQVSARVRETAGLDAAVDRILDVYQECLSDWSSSRSDATAQNQESLSLADYLRYLSVLVRNPGAGSPMPTDLQAEVQRLTSENHRLQAEVQRLTSENHKLQAELHAREQEMSRISRTLTWRARQHLLSFGWLRRLHAVLARLYQHPQSVDEAPQFGEHGRDE